MDSQKIDIKQIKNLMINSVFKVRGIEKFKMICHTILTKF